VRTAKGRATSSTRWLERQLNDPYVTEAQARGYRSRAAFKLMQLDEKFDFLRNSRRVVDLGCAPGGWLQVARERCPPDAVIVGIDLNDVAPLEGVEVIRGDFYSDDDRGRLIEGLGGAADLVLSDMAASSTGHAKTDHLRVMGLVEAALEFAEEILAPGGAFVAKVLQGGTEHELLHHMKRRFEKVRHVKPAASRSDSAEIYLVASGFRPENPAYRA
jgi:23S rRNA (uridine2552-2'-O)-methyltransferase